MVFIVEENGNIFLGVPLYTRVHVNARPTGFMVSAITMEVGYDDPVAYAVDIGEGDLQIFNAEFVEERFECLGPLHGE